MPKPVGKCKALNDTSNNTGYGLKVNSYQYFCTKTDLTSFFILPLPSHNKILLGSGGAHI